MTDPQTDPTLAKLLEAALPHVAFDGWSETTFRAASEDAEIDPAMARALCPRGAVDLAVAFHAAGDAAMLRALATADLTTLRIREKITFAVRARIEAIEDREAVRRGTTLFALPLYAADGARLIWGTADAIWTAIGDTSDDVNWYTKRATLSGVYSATVLYWLGDTSAGNVDTWAFLDRRIEGVMQFEKMKAKVRETAVLKPFLAGPNWLASQIKPPKSGGLPDLPGMFRRSGARG